MLKLAQFQQAWSLAASAYQIAALQQRFAQAGVRAGQVVAVSAPNTPLYLWSLLACWSLGALSLTLNPRLPEAVLLQSLKQAEAAYWLSPKLLPLPTGVQALPWSPPEPQRVGNESFQALPFVPEQALTLIQTSGSSRQPRLAQHSWGNHLSSARGSAWHLPLASGDRWLLALPLYHVGGLAIVFRCLLADASLLLPEPAQALADAICSLDPTHLSLVPTQLHRLLQEPLEPELLAALRACRAILIGGSAISTALLQRAYQLGLALHTSYGSTEMSSQITSTPPGAAWERLQTAGSLLPERELRLSDTGEIWVRGATLFQGYRQGSQLDLPLNASGWFATRDRGCWTPDGDLKVLGRLDQQFISGGENIQPEEIEAHLMDCPGVLQALVVPVQEPEFGQRPVAFVASADWQPALWLAHLRDCLPGFKLPVAFFAWPEHTALKPARREWAARAQKLFENHTKAI